MVLSTSDIHTFQDDVLRQGALLYREMPWRADCNPYYILLSEVMLQQTQVPRVLQKFSEFITAFPTLESLALADFYQVLSCWSGLGYNRRAKFLHQAAIQIHNRGAFPETVKELQQLPGIGPNTAASILVYAFNQSQVFIETNVRTVFIYHFFQHSSEKISEKDLHTLVEQTLYTVNPRQWYWALMDYGTYIKKTYGNFNAMSTMHTTQSKFEGSVRQKRAAILRFLIQQGAQSAESISYSLEYTLEDIIPLLNVLQTQGMIRCENALYCIA